MSIKHDEVLLKERRTLLLNRDLMAETLGTYNAQSPNGGSSRGKGVRGELSKFRALVNWSATEKGEATMLAQAQERNQSYPIHLANQLNNWQRSIDALTKREKLFSTELANCEAALKRFEAANPDLNNLSLDDIDILLDDKGADDTNVPAARLATEKTTQDADDAAIAALADASS